MLKKVKNIRCSTVEGFGEEWSVYDQSQVKEAEIANMFEAYFHIFPWQDLPVGSIGMDVGCGSGRWALKAAQQVGSLFCVDASEKALAVAKKNLAHTPNCHLMRASVDGLPFPDETMDFGYSLGVLHHLPDTALGLKACVEKLKPGAPFLLYLYYALDNKPVWFRGLWRVSDFFRQKISVLPFHARLLSTKVIALTIYWPLARTALLLEKMGLPVQSLPLSFYRSKSFYIMCNDALDRFGTDLEQRFTKAQITEMMGVAGLKNIRFSEDPPFWCAVGIKK